MWCRFRSMISYDFETSSYDHCLVFVIYVKQYYEHKGNWNIQGSVNSFDVFVPNSAVVKIVFIPCLWPRGRSFFYSLKERRFFKCDLFTLAPLSHAQHNNGRKILESSNNTFYCGFPVSISGVMIADGKSCSKAHKYIQKSGKKEKQDEYDINILALLMLSAYWVTSRFDNGTVLCMFCIKVTDDYYSNHFRKMSVLTTRKPFSVMLVRDK